MYIIADIGGTKTRIARSDDLLKFGEPIIVDTPKDDRESIALVADTIERLRAGETLQHACIGKPGWREKLHFSDELQKRIDAPIVIENDTALVGLGEAHFGAGKGTDIFVYITISTGVNGARICGGAIDASAQGFEIGGQYLGLDGTLSWEEMISGTAVAKRFGMHPKELGKAHPIWEELAKTAAYGIHNAILHWSPEKIAIGGSMMNEIGIPVDRIRFHLSQIMRKFTAVPEIVHAELGELGGLYGGLARLKQLR